MHSALPITIRPAYADDGETLRRLAILDSAPSVPPGRLLVAEVDGELVAALAPESGAVIADPFRPTAALVELLRAHVRMLAAADAAAKRSSARPRLRTRPALRPAA